MTDARCAAHPDLAAIGTCARCGDYFCNACGHARQPGVCVRCGARLPSGLAWEDPRGGRLPARFLKTTRDLILRPSVAFPGPARAGRAAGFAVLWGLGLGLILVLGVGVFLSVPGSPLAPRVVGSTLEDPLMAAFVVGLAVLTPIPLLLLAAWLESLSFALGLQAVGRRVGTLKFALRTCLYAQLFLALCVALPSFAALASALVPNDTLLAGVRVSWIVSGAVLPVLTGRICFFAARGLGLGNARAGLAALGPTLLCSMAAAYQTHRMVELLG